MKRLPQISAFVVLLATNMYGSSAWAKKVDVAAGLACTRLPQCIRFDDLYEGSLAFRKVFLSSLKRSGIQKPSWVPNGTFSQMVPIILGGVRYHIGNICQPHFCDHAINLLYSQTSNHVVGMYKKDGQSPSRWFGEPNQSERRVILDYSGISRKSILDVTYDTPLPVVIR